MTEAMSSRIYFADLRHSLIPCGECTEEEEEEIVASIEDQQKMTDTEVKQLTSLLSGWQQSMAHFQGQTEMQIKDMRDDIKTVFAMLKEQSALITETYSKVTNGQEDRLKKLEKHVDGLETNYITRHEFNGAMNSFRSTVSQLKWIFGLGFSSIVGLLVAQIFL